MQSFPLGLIGATLVGAVGLSPSLAHGAQAGLPYVFDAGAAVLGLATDGVPDTVLDVDPSTGLWRTDALLKPQPLAGYPALALWLGGELELSRSWALRLRLDSGEIRSGQSYDPPTTGWSSYGLSLKDAALSGAFIRELALSWVHRGISVELGRRQYEVADGLVYDDFGTGVAGVLDLAERDGIPWRFEADAFLVGRTWDDLATLSPLVKLRADYVLSPFESVGLFAAAYLDRGGALSEVARSAAAESIAVHQSAVATQLALTDLLAIPHPSRAAIGYAGLSLSLLPFVGVSVRATAVVQVGRLAIQLGPNTQRRLRLGGWAGQIEIHKGLGQHWDLGGFALALSGSQPVLRNNARYGSFIGIAPAWSWTGLFFSGGISQSYYAARASAAGTNGHGVIGVGPIVSWSSERLDIELRGTPLWALAAAPSSPFGGGGRFYGVEGDLRGELSCTDWLTIAVELDALSPGSFFAASRGAWRAIALVEFHAESS